MKFHLFRKVSKTIGNSPGTITYVGAPRDEEIILKLIQYDSQNLISEDVSESQLPEISQKSGIKWLNIVGIHESEVIEKIGKIFEIHSLVLEDIVNTAQQPKIEDYENLIYVALKMFYVDTNEEIKMEHVNFIIKNDLLLSFQEVKGDVFQPVRKHLNDGRKKIRSSNSDYLLYALIDTIVDNYYLVIQKFGEQIDKLKKSITTNPNQKNLLELDKLYEETLIMQNSMDPLKHMIPKLEEYETELFHNENHMYFRDLQDHIVQISAMIDMVNEKLSSLNDYYLAVISNRTNEVMKTLALVATICVPITVVAGIYGMNFQYMPELSSPFAYPIVLVVMVGIAGSLFGYFKKKKWV